jgi:NAD(P)H-hydrate epimerase
MTGAALLASTSALRAGAGLVTLGVPRRIHPWLASRVTCEMTLPLPDTDAGTFAREGAEAALEFLSRCMAGAIGPGVSTHGETGDFIRDVVRAAGVPLVVDADGLNHLAGHLEAVADAPAPRILTPHPGEFARLSGESVPEVQADRAVSAKRLALRTGAVVVLKGWQTVVTDGSKLYINSTGNPGMASGGTGDVLTGVVAGLAGMGLSPFDAASLGVYVHGRAGDLAAAMVGEISCTASDVLEGLAPAFMELEARHDG